MSNQSYNAIVLRATPYRDYDKRVRLFSAEQGIIDVVMKGVQKPNAKLKYAAQPFSFGVYEVNEKNGFYTVTNAIINETLFSITSDADKYICGCIVLECIEAVNESISSDSTYILLLRTLQSLLYSSGNPKIIVAKLVQKLLSLAGFTVNKSVSKSLDTPQNILDYIATKKLDEIFDLDIPELLATRTLKQITLQFQNTFERKINSLSLL